MLLKFSKLQGTGNDFIVIDNRDGKFPKIDSLIVKLCDRKFGIGSDGLILIENNFESDFEMIFYNPDASMSFCGNGSRCAVKFAKNLGLINTNGSFKAIDGIHHFEIDNEIISIKMLSVSSIKNIGNDFFLNTGSPHYINYTTDLAKVNIVEFGRKIRYSDPFKDINGTNVNVVEEVSLNKIKISTYERGVENETLSCGTGVTACAIIQGVKNNVNEIDIETKGGNLIVRFNQISGNIIDDIWLSGPAIKVYSGEIEI